MNFTLLYCIDSIHAIVGRVEKKGLKATISQKYQNNLVYLDGLRIYSGALTSLTIMHTKHLACFQSSLSRRLYNYWKNSEVALKSSFGLKNTTTVSRLRRLIKQLQGYSPARDWHLDPLAQSAVKGVIAQLRWMLSLQNEALSLTSSAVQSTKAARLIDSIPLKRQISFGNHIP